jgi:guanylate kinase
VSTRGELIIISGPSGAGKSTIVRRLIEQCPLPLKLSVSATTRPPRPGEIDGVHYQFLASDQFQNFRKAGELIECAEVFGVGDWYGTPRQPVEEMLDSGYHVILEIDVQGALQVLEVYPRAITVFVHPGSMEELEKRLRGRKTEPEERILARLAVAAGELALADRYDHIVLNDQIETSHNTICRLLKTAIAEKQKEQQRCTKN